MPLNMVSFASSEEIILKVRSGKNTILKMRNTGKFESSLANHHVQITPTNVIAVKK